MRYGCVPSVHSVGTLGDIIIDYDAETDTGLGFTFAEPSADALAATVQRSINAYRYKSFPNLVRRVMRYDGSWREAAQRYKVLYEEIVAGRALGMPN